MSSSWRLRARTLPALLLCLVVLTPVAARAEPGTAERCQAEKLRAAGVEARDRLKCEKKGLDSGASATCVSKAQQRRALAFARAESRGGCVTTADSGVIGDEVSALVAAALNELRPGGPAGSRCTSAQLSAMGRSVLRMMRAHARDKQSPDPLRLAAELQAALDDFATSFANAVQRGDCLSNRTVAQASAIIANAVARLRGKLCPMCGDGVGGPGEACDGSDTGSCPFGCASDCSCAPPTCPCWTAASLIADYPLGIFDPNGLGGPVCMANTSPVVVSITSEDSCLITGPGGFSATFPRVGFVLLDLNACLAAPSDLDPDNNGTCNGPPPVVHPLSSEETQACNDEVFAALTELGQHCVD